MKKLSMRNLTGYSRKQFPIALMTLATLMVVGFLAYWRRTPDNSTNETISLAKSRSVQFGIVGFIDVNKDGKDDLDEIKKAIEDNGGVVSLFQRPDGSIVGKLTPNVSFLIVDSFSDDKLASNAIATKAPDYGIQVMEVQSLLKYIKKTENNDLQPSAM